MSLSYAELKSNLQSLKNSRKEYLYIKSNMINNMSTYKNFSPLNTIDKATDNLKEIDQQIEALSSIISTSVNISSSIMVPVKEKEIIINNVTKTVKIIEIERKIKELLSKLDQENLIEKKIQIILEANNYIKINPSIFEGYREQFMKKSLDVLSYLNTNYLSLQEKVKNSKEKECVEYLNEMDKNSVLNYKLSNNPDGLIKFFEFLASTIKNECCSEEVYQDFEEKVNAAINGNPEPKDIKGLFENLKKTIMKIFRKISQNIQERQSSYLNFESTNTKNEKEPIFYYFIGKLVKGNEKIIISLLSLLVRTSKLSEQNKEYHDLLCIIYSNALSTCEKFKFYIQTISEKAKIFYNYSSEPNNQIDDTTSFFMAFDSVLYDIGEQYCNNEIKFMKSSINSFFINDSRECYTFFEQNYNKSLDELGYDMLKTIEDSFYILKTCGCRAISTLNLQMSLAIINHIKDIINEHLYSLLDIKISAILIKTESIPSDEIPKIKYTCPTEPSLCPEYTYGNIFLINCLDSIDQTREDLPNLFKMLKDQVDKTILNSPVFNTDTIKLVGMDEKNDKKIPYFKSNEIEMINITFSDQNIIFKKYDDFMVKKLKLSFEYLYNKINSTIDVLNSVNYVIDQSNIVTAEMTVTFSSLFMEETEKILKQWKNQLTEGAFAKFIEYYAEYAAGYIEKVLKRKNYSSYGVIILQKDINKIANYFQGDLLLGIRDKFNRLFNLVKVLNFETKEELEEHLKKYDDITLKIEEINFIRSLKKD